MFYSVCPSLFYQGNTVSDSTLRNKLEEIADYFCSRLWVTSGDRNGGGGSLVSIPTGGGGVAQW